MTCYLLWDILYVLQRRESNAFTSGCGPAGEKSVNKKLRVLVADNQEPIRQGITALLELTPDIEVCQEASNGWEAVQFVAEEQPDVVLMDVRMPVMDGLEATRQIKDRWPLVKVVVLTLYGSHRDEALAAGADLFLLKGDMCSSLTEVIRSLPVSPRTDEGGAKNLKYQDKVKKMNHE